MKTFLLSLFLLLAFTRKLTSATASTTVDIDGKIVRNDGTFAYYILPVIRGRSAGGLGLSRTRSIGNETCPLIIAQDPSELNYALPIEIPTPARISLLSTTLQLQFQYIHDPSTCGVMPSSWSVVEELPKGWSIKIGDFQRTVDGWFKLEAYGDTHYDKLVFCRRSDLACGDLGIYADERQNLFLIVIF